MFDVEGTKSIDEGKINFVTNGGINFVGRINGNNGIKGKISKQLFEPNEPYTITATVIGNYKYVKYQKEQYYCSQNINKLAPKFKITDNIAIYFITLIQKFVSLFNGQQAGYKITQLKKFKICVPIDNKKNISFTFIENYISELEEERISELTAYLKVSGLDNYELSNKENEAIKNMNSGNICFKKIKIKELFEIDTGRDVIIGTTKNGNIPLISNQNKNNGITKYIKKLNNRKLFDYKKTLALADRGIFYATTQLEKFHIGTRVKALTFKKGNMSEEIRLFFSISINKLQELFKEYDNNATDKLPDLEIALPIMANGSINYNFMETYITAQEKLAIKDVVTWKDKVISKTKEII